MIFEQYEGEDFLVDVPVKINIWIRPDCQKKQFEIIKQAKPSVLFIQSDGGRNGEEQRIINENRKMIEEGISWKCKVYKIYEDTNQGLYTMGAKTRDVIWRTVDRCVFTEDDQLPSVSFFRYCAEMLEKYKDDERIECICGMNHLGKYEDTDSDYFFSRQGSIWGVATWKRVVENWGSFDYGNSNYTMSILKERTKHNKAIWNRLNTYAHKELCEGHVAATEFWLEFDVYSQNRLQIIPKYNLISNIGTTETSAHSGQLKNMPRKLRQVFHSDTYELKFPLVHPKYVMPDINYEKKRNQIMGYNTPIISFFRKVEYLFLLLKNEGLGHVVSRIGRKITHAERTEK